MRLASGTRLGPYEILAPLGSGGMGEVYRAIDKRLERTVAIKILPKDMSANLVRKQRFEREAKVISGLNHPNICVLHDVGCQDGVDYLVMECIEGETLAKRLNRGRLPLEQVLKYGAQIADALDKAHRSGVVHRDLKPGNIMLTSTGAKLLDFGLAKPASSLSTGLTLTAAETQTAPVTEDGAIVGTIQYMSPEQLEGKELDGRSDIFSFGAVLYEMVTGQRAFPGKSQLSVASAILEKEPVPIHSMRPLSPPMLDHVIHRCLAKDTNGRWQTAHDVELELQWIAREGLQTGPAPTVSPNMIRWRWAFGIVSTALVAVAILLSIFRWGSTPSKVQPIRFLVFPPQDAASERSPSISPDGTKLAFVATVPGMPPSLWLRRLDLTTPQQLRGTQDAASPFWSPDSRFIGFFAEGKLKRIDASGGSAQVLCDTDSGNGTWSRSGIVLFSQRLGLYQVPEDGGTPVLVTELDTSRHETAHLWPHFLPDGQHYMYLALNSDRGNDAIYVSSLKAKDHTRLLSSDSMGIYVSGPKRRGYVLFVRNGSLMEQAFDADKLKLIGEPALIVDGLIDPDGNPHIQGNFSASDTGVLAYHSGADPDNSTKTELVWFERSGKRLETIELPGLKFVPRISPNGKQLAIERVDAKTGNLNIWVLGLDRGSASPFTLDSTGHNFAPVWSADGTRLVFASSRSGHQGLYQKSASGAEDEQLLLPTAPNFTFPTDWSQDGRFVAYTVQQPDAKYDLWILPLEGDRKPFPFLQTPFSEMYGHFSPDGRWLAYSSDESGRWEIYIRTFRQAGSGGQWQISNQGGTHPFWRRDGKELFYIAADRRLMSVDINTRQKKNQLELEPGLPKALLNTGTTFSTRRPYAVTADGQRFLILTRAVGDKGPEPITVVVNWAPDLKQP